jgi:predicted glycosyltransferase
VAAGARWRRAAIDADVAPPAMFRNLPFREIKAPSLTALYQDEPGLAQLRALKADVATLNKFRENIALATTPNIKPSEIFLIYSGPTVVK